MSFDNEVFSKVFNIMSFQFYYCICYVWISSLLFNISGCIRCSICYLAMNYIIIMVLFPFIMLTCWVI